MEYCNVETTEPVISSPASGKKEKATRGGRKKNTNDAPSDSSKDSSNGDFSKDFLSLSEKSLRPAVEISLKTLLEAGVHFGHQTSRWHPAMAPYIYTVRNGVHIINLPKTVTSWAAAREAIVNTMARGGSILFVGTKKQAQEAIIEEAKRCAGFYVCRRWLGGMLTNFQTIRRSIERLKTIEQTLVEEEERLTLQRAAIQEQQDRSDQKDEKEGERAQALMQKIGPKFTKKERLMMDREREKLLFSLEGIREMYSSPDLLFVVDIKREEIALREAKRLDIPVIALVDTNCSPQGVDFPIPSNDDATRAIRLFASAVADAVLEGKRIYAERKIKTKDKEEAPAEKGSRKRSAKAGEEKKVENEFLQEGEEISPEGVSEVENT